MPELMSDEEILEQLEREPALIERLARALMSTFRVVTGKRSRTTVTVEPTVAHPVVLPANSYCALIQGQSLDQTTLFKTVADHTVEPGGSPVELVSHLGGVRMNLKAGTEL